MKKILLILILCLIFTIPVYPADLFSDGFESGDTSAWSSELDVESDLTITEIASLHGTYGMNLLIDNTTFMYVRDDTPATETRYRCRFYIHPNSLTMAEGNSFVFGYGLNEAGSGQIEIDLYYTGAAGYQIRARIRNDGGAWQSTSYCAITNALHCVEIDWFQSTGANDGYISLWIDGVFKETVSSIDNDTKDIGRFYLGAATRLDAGTSGTFYLDDFASNDDGGEIGIISAGMTWNTATISKWNTATISKWNGI